MNSSHRHGLRVTAAASFVALLLSALVATPAAAIENIATITTGNGAVRVAFAPDGLTAYGTNQDDDTVSVIDVPSYMVIDTIAVGDEPYGIKVSPDGTLVYVVNFAGSSVSVIDVATAAVVDTIAVGTFPYDVEFSADGAKAYVTGYGSASVKVIDVATATVSSSIPSGGQPQGIALSPDGTFLYVTDVNGTNVHVIDVATDTIVDTVSDASFQWADSVVFTPDGLYAYVSNNLGGALDEGTVSVIDVVLGTVIDVITVGRYPQFVDVSADGATVYVTHSEGGTSTDGVNLIDVATGSVGPLLAPDYNPYSAVVSPDGNLVYVSNNADSSITVLADPVRRVTGTNRYGTAIKISQAAFPGGADIVYVATGTDYPDALAAGPAAAWNGAPVILTDNTVLAPEVKAEIQRLNPSTIKIVGGTNRVSTGIQTELESIATVQRITGSNRYETSRDIALDAFDTAANGGGAPVVFIATGLNFPDALAAGAAGGAIGAPVILVNGTLPTVDQATLDLLADFGTTDIIVVGGTNMVSAGIESQLGAFRLTGTNRYGTALAINEAVYDVGSGATATTAILATGVIFPDALAASAWAGRIGAPLYLAPTSCVPQGVLDHMTALGVIQVVLVGGPDRLTQSVFDLTPC